MDVLCLGWVNGWSLLEKPKVQRVVSLAASVVGVICYALSSTFNQLLGNWTWWKILLYIVFSLIICLAVLFSPARSTSRSTSQRLEVHLAFLVLILASVYSFLFENVVKGKPDAYSMISCAAFATMSLGLSNLNQFGFQIDLLYFFCELLIIQLLMIKWWLGFVGGGFSYGLLQLRYFASKREGDDPERVSSGSHVINMPQEGGVDSTPVTSPEDGQGHQLTQSIVPHPVVNLVMDEPPSEITRHRIKNAMKLNSERAHSISTGETSSTRLDPTTAEDPTRLAPTTAKDPTKLAPTKVEDPTRENPTTADLRRIRSSKFQREPNVLPMNPFSRAKIREPSAKTTFSGNHQTNGGIISSAKTNFNRNHQTNSGIIRESSAQTTFSGNHQTNGGIFSSAKTNFSRNHQRNGGIIRESSAKTTFSGNHQTNGGIISSAKTTFSRNHQTNGGIVSRAETTFSRNNQGNGGNIGESSAKTTFRGKLRPPDSSAKYKNF